MIQSEVNISVLEKEVKLLLTEEEYLLLERSFDFSSEVVQKNNYYRSAVCAEKRISVRIREVTGKKLLQIKKPVSREDAPAEEGSLMVREEIERELDSVPHIIPAELMKEVCGVEDDALFIGALTTKRMLCYDFENVELALDRNEYLGTVDYELEAEYTGEYPAGLIARIAALGITTDRPAEGKYSRFCRRLAEVSDYGTTS
ncbi:Uncharacterized protein YjbK [Ruminococcaceae bacterium FB2012]|nr:Uncharacterized protein YjbK [Ruminococcaceae bacterium FB2012]